MINRRTPQWLSLFMAACLLAACQTNGTAGGSMNQADSNTFPALISAARHAYQQGDLHAAEGLWRQLLQRDKQLYEGWCQLGHIGFRQHQYQSAVEAYQRCLQLHPQQPAIWHNLAVVRLRQATELLLQGQAYADQQEASDTQQQQQLLQHLLKLQRVSLVSHDAN